MNQTVIFLFVSALIAVQCNAVQDVASSSNVSSDGNVTSYVFSPTLGMQAWKMLYWQGSVKSESSAIAVTEYAKHEKTREQVLKFTNAMAKSKFVIATRLLEWGGFSMQHAANQEVFDKYRFSVFVPEEESCDFSFRIHIKEDGLLSHADYLNVTKGSWQQFTYRSEIVPTQLEFQKLDNITCDVYFTDLALVGNGTFRDIDSEQESGAPLLRASMMLALLTFIALLLF